MPEVQVLARNDSRPARQSGQNRQSDRSGYATGTHAAGYGAGMGMVPWWGMGAVVWGTGTGVWGMVPASGWVWYRLVVYRPGCGLYRPGCGLVPARLWGCTGLAVVIAWLCWYRPGCGNSLGVGVCGVPAGQTHPRIRQNDRF